MDGAIHGGIHHIPTEEYIIRTDLKVVETGKVDGRIGVVVIPDTSADNSVHGFSFIYGFDRYLRVVQTSGIGRIHEILTFLIEDEQIEHHRYILGNSIILLTGLCEKKR